MKLANIFQVIKSKFFSRRKEHINFVSLDDKSDFILILTQYKRRNLEAQLKAVLNQSLLPDKIFVFQNEHHINVDHIVEKYGVELVKSSYNTKYFGRFAFCLGLNSKAFVIMDDDIIPGKDCFKKYLDEAKKLNGIIGGNGRYGYLNKNYKDLPVIKDTGIREQSIEVDFVGHIWVVTKSNLMDMFSIKPCTYHTGEDMHLCFSAKLKSGVKSYVCAQTTKEEMSDIKNNRLAVDAHSSFLTTTQPHRISVENYFKNLGLKFYGE